MLQPVECSEEQSLNNARFQRPLFFAKMAQENPQIKKLGCRNDTSLSRRATLIQKVHTYKINLYNHGAFLSLAFYKAPNLHGDLIKTNYSA